MSIISIIILSTATAALAVLLHAVHQDVAEGQRQNAEDIDELKERVRELEDEQFRKDMGYLDILDAKGRPMP